MRRKSAEPAQKPKRAKNLLSTAVETLEERLRASGVTVTGLGEPLPPRKFIATFIPRKREAGQSRKESSHARGTLHDIEKEVVKTLSSCKRAIPGFQRLSDDAASGDKAAALVVCELAYVAITYLLGGIGSVDVFHTSPMGLFGEQFEPSLGIRIEAAKTKRAPVLATLAAFAKNFNQGEVHVQAAPKRGTKAGLRYTDGSFNTCRYQIKLGESLSRPDVVSLYQQSGLFGDTVSGDFMSAYYAGDTGTIQEVERFTAQIERLYELVGENGRGVNREIVRLWRYGDGRKGTISLSTIRGEIHLPSAEGSRAARHIAARLANRQVMEAPALDVQSNSSSDNLTEAENSKSPLARMADRLNTHLRDSGYTVTEEPGALTPGEFVATFIPRKRKKTDRKTKKKSD